MDRNYQDIDLDEIKRRIREDAEQIEALPAPGPGRSGRGRIAHLRLSRLDFQAPFQSNFRDSYTYQELARYDDRQFIENAYLALLRHRPDPAGEKHHTDNLRRGRSKLITLLRLRFSSEGRTQRVRLRGLFWPLVREGLYLIPLVGPLIRAFVELLFLPSTLRDVTMRQEMLRDRVNATAESVQAKINELIRDRNDGRRA